MSWFDEVSELFKKYDIPDFVWIPIMMCESAANPNARSSSQRVIEISKGLFQINILANPQYANLDLYNPIINAEIAARDFILPAYKKTQELGLENPLDITEYVWHFGIRPYWDNSHQEIIRQETQKVLDGVVLSNSDLNSNINVKMSKMNFINKLIQRLKK